MGLAIIDDEVEEGAPLRYADIAMFNAKTQRLGVEVYRDEIDRRTPARLSMLGDLRRRWMMTCRQEILTQRSRIGGTSF